MKTIKVFSKNVLKILNKLNTGYTNHLDFEEDLGFLGFDEKAEFTAIVNFMIKNSETNFVEI